MGIERNNITEIFGISKSYLSNLNDKELKLLADKIDTNEIDRFILLKPLISDTESMDAEEKQYWFDILPHIESHHIKSLLDILVVEMRKLNALNSKYHEQLKDLNN